MRGTEGASGGGTPLPEREQGDPRGLSPLGPGREFDLIRRLLGPIRSLPPGVLVGPGDDCLVLADGLVISVDISVEGIHFRRDWVRLEEAGYRAAAAALSALAAMAAEPVGLLLSMALGPAEAEDAAPALQRGASRACEREGIGILGGDLSASPGPVILDVVVLGRSPTPLLRSGSLPGDEVWVTGWLGRSAAAVDQWGKGLDPSPSFRKAFVDPRPRIRELRWLAGRARLHAGIDLSDGLAGDAGHLAAASGVAVVLQPENLPIPSDLEREIGNREECLHFALRGGEDYEVCVTAPEGTLGPLEAFFSEEFGIPLTRVGRVVEGEGVYLEGPEGRERLSTGGFTHFEEREIG